MSKEQERQQKRKLEYFMKWLDEEFSGAKYNATSMMKEAMIMAYKRGRGDKI